MAPVAIAAVPASTAATVPLRVIAFNDLHGNLVAPEPAVPGAPTLGGIDAIAAHIEYLKQQRSHGLVVSAGDLVGASPLLSAWFHDEPTIELANRLPLAFNAVGNHEFDEGLDELLRLLRGGCHATDPLHSCQGRLVDTPVPFEGARFAMLGANVRDALGRSPLPAFGIESVDGVRVGFIGVTLRGTARLLAPFAAANLAFGDEADAIDAAVRELRTRGVAAIVVLIHEGGKQLRTDALDINGCAGDMIDTPIRRIVARLDDAIDAVITGHTHAAYICRLPNAAGRAIPVTSAGEYGRLLTVLDLELARAGGDVVRAEARNIPVARDLAAAPRNTAVDTLLARYRAVVAPLENRHAGFIGSPVTTRKNPACEMTAGALVADAQALAAQPVPFGAANFALVNPGGIRAPGLVAPGAVAVGDLFRMQPFGNTLVTLALTGYQIETLLEQQFAGCYGQATTRILQPSAGFTFRWDSSRPVCQKIAKIALHGTELDPKATYRVAMNDFLAAGGDGFTVLREATHPLRGPRELQALVDYLGAYDLVRGSLPYDPAAWMPGNHRIVRMDAARSCE